MSELLDSLSSQCTDLLAERPHSLISTLSPALDSVLDGGLELGQVVELCGSSGSGKTQLAMQCALSAAAPRWIGGVDGASIFIDTECAFAGARAEQLARALVAAIMRAHGRSGDDDGHNAALDTNDTDNSDTAASRVPSHAELLRRVHIYQSHSLHDLAALVHALPVLVRRHDARLVVLDSVAMVARGELGGNDQIMLRQRQLVALAQRLAALAHHCGVAVLLTNHVTRGRAALGDRWLACAAKRLWLALHASTTRSAELVAGGPPRHTEFAIDASGVR